MRRTGVMRRLPAALREYLAAQGLEVDSAEPQGHDAWRIAGRRWWPVEVPGRAAPLHVALTVCVEVRRSADGAWCAELPVPGADELHEAAAFARSLSGHGQIGARGSPRGGASHEIVVDAAGREKLVRRRFSAR